MKYQLDFTGEVVMVTGASGGLGKAICEGFAQNGAKLLLVGRNLEKLNETKQAVEAAGGVCEIYQTDANDNAAVDRMLEAVKEKYGQLDVLVSNAGIGHRIPSTEVTEELWNSVITTNLSSQFLLAAKVAKLFMLPRKKGKIVFTASMGGFVGIPGSAAYSASKGALLQTARSLSTEWAPYNVQVNCICPGYVETDLIKAAMNIEAWVNLVKLRTPAGRLGKPEDVVGAALFLSSGLANFITGTYIQIDGGGYAQGY